MPDEIAVSVHDRWTTLDGLDELAELYEQVYSEPPYNSSAKYSRTRFLSRTRDQALASGFQLVTAHRKGALAGFAFGFSMMPGAWWANASAPPPEVLEADKYAVIELVVTKAERGHGLGRQLLDELLAGRPEQYATLAAVIEADAYEMYRRWGWQKAGEFRAEPPFSDALVLPLRPDNGAAPV
ncbi:GNAT family N-acetyltransferase [Spirillospora sp. NBC_00431]